MFFHLPSFAFIFLFFPSFSFFSFFSFMFLHFPSISFNFLHFPSISFNFLHVPACSCMFLHVPSFSLIFSHFLSCSFIFFHFLSFSLSLLGAQNLIFWGLNFVTISLDSSYVKNQFLGPSGVVLNPFLHTRRRGGEEGRGRERRVIASSAHQNGPRRVIT